MKKEKIGKVIRNTLVTASALVVLAACGGGNNATATKDGEKPAQEFRISGMLGDGANDAIGNYWHNSGGMMPYLLYRPILKLDPATQELKPDLAESWKMSEDGLTYTFDLKDNLKWSDGDDLTVDDVKFSIETALKTSLINGIFPENFLKIEGAKDFQEGKTDTISGITIDKDIITIKLKEKVGLFANVLGQFLIFPQHKLAGENALEIHNSDFWKNPVSSGMYKVSEISAGNYIALDKNTNYEGTAPKIDTVKMVFLNDSVLAVQDGQSYYYATGRLNEIEQLSTVPGVQKFDVDVLYYRYFISNLAGQKGEGNSSVSDFKVREALMYAIDRPTLAKSVWQNSVTVNNTGVPVAFSEYDKSLNTYEFNPDKAKQLLTEAGFDFGKTFKIAYYHKDPATVSFIEAVSQQLKDIGINVEATLISSDPTTALFKTRDYDIALKAFSSFSYESWYGEYSSNNTTFKNIFNGDSAFDEKLALLASTSEDSKRADILKDLQKIEQEKLLKLPMFTSQNYIYINTDKVQLPENIKLANPFYHFDLRFEEWSIK